MIGVNRKNRKSTNWIRKHSGVTNIISNIKESKHRRVGNVAKRSDNRWIESQNGYHVNIKDLKTDQERHGMTT